VIARNQSIRTLGRLSIGTTGREFMKIAGDVVVVTGASSGLGAEMARQLGRMGLRVGLTARREAELHEVADSIRSAGGTAFVAPADAADPSALKAAIGAIVETLGPVDLLIANAGLGVASMAVDFSAEAFDRMVRVNLTSVGYAIEAVLPRMIRDRRGQIVGISSLAGFRGLPGSPGYSATKAGLSTLLEGLRPDLRRYGIAVTIVHPGYVRTPMTAGSSKLRPLIMDLEPAVQIILRGIAARRSRVDFPWRMATFLGFIRLLPDRVFDSLAGRFLLGPIDQSGQ
jgi:short-subunit dehydrogenase